jgi:hypothetical protein
MLLLEGLFEGLQALGGGLVLILALGVANAVSIGQELMHGIVECTSNIAEDVLRATHDGLLDSEDARDIQRTLYAVSHGALYDVPNPHSLRRLHACP